MQFDEERRVIKGQSTAMIHGDDDDDDYEGDDEGGSLDRSHGSERLVY